MIDLGLTGRTLFCAAWLGVQSALVLTADARTDKAWGFRMYDESSTVKLNVARELDDGGLVPIEGDTWRARDCAGVERAFSWKAMVRFPAPPQLNRTIRAPYGVAAAEEQVRAAVAWVATHTPDDCQTRALRAEAILRKNGHPPSTVTWIERRAP